MKEISKQLSVRASPLVLSMWPWTLKWDEEKSTYACLAQENGFSPAYLLAPEAGKKRSQAVHLLAREECNKYDLTTVPYFWLANQNDWSSPGGLLLVVPT